MERRLWSQEEDRSLRQLVKEHGPQKWTYVAQLMQARFHSFDRNGKQCRERWFNHLEDSLLKDVWSFQQQQLFIQHHSRLGNRWSQISRLMPGRAQNTIKNYFYSSLRRTLRIVNKYAEDQNLKEMSIKMTFVNKMISLFDEGKSPLNASARIFIKLALKIAIRRSKTDQQLFDQAVVCLELLKMSQALKTKRREPAQDEPQPRWGEGRQKQKCRLQILRNKIEQGATSVPDSSFKPSRRPEAIGFQPCSLAVVLVTLTPHQY